MANDGRKRAALMRLDAELERYDVFKYWIGMDCCKNNPEEKQLHTHETDRDAIERGENEGMTVPLDSIITPELRANPRRGRKSTDHPTPQLPKIASSVHVHLAAS